MLNLLSDRASLLSPAPLMTTEEARMLGIVVPSAEWVRVRRGVYAARGACDSLPPWMRYALRVHAYLRAHPDAILCLESAAVIHGLPLFGEPRDIHVYDPVRTASRRRGDVAVHTGAMPREVVAVEGIRVTAVLDTVVDLARLLPPAQALALVDTAIAPAQGGPLLLRDLRDRSESQPGSRGRRRMPWLWRRADPASESPAESVSRAVIEWCGFESPASQREFRYEDARDRVDFFFPSCRAIAEVDGWQKYGDDERTRSRRFREEKQREDRLRRHGHPFARWSLSDAWRVEPLAQALRVARVPLVARPQTAMLATLHGSPREKPRSA
ncbi:hypothetical protein GCM10025768_07140 [Microbacterium pseudoresistens]|uniref:Transcriptional regulator, AbiEi antitoxin, Type IV TA system n=1 Tax=Microbacterium pseudoresistens TaxID=640634 RepID=A0A7Y9EVE7_9MICO|nr:hypothetical protein [Microbacterium pseudoresistens]NYD54551.1 hypothetical protein [Microbacterium pseudoresistens]